MTYRIIYVFTEHLTYESYDKNRKWNYNPLTLVTCSVTRFLSTLKVRPLS